MRKRAMGCEFTMRKSDGVRVDQEKKRDGGKVEKEKKSNGLKFYHKKERWGES